ncbi:3-hydroxyacyl-ACP dehydratase [Mucilaginibacter ginsenosidivorans]|uniref:3-hydroxyacyl-ACP dehydratase n=1 Tax=Mucilaginibacter ginsenosidivorans TaxID=398053 RepID=A0A5B8V2G7_9SPHI|nr:3-hydroxyacyl-ACP dehydratase [Mucilaginibacter ginsenosidivorans]
MPAEDIIPLIPQKPPFVMVGRLMSSDENLTRSSFVIPENNVFVKKGLFQEAGLMENIAQTAALRAGYIAQSENKPVAVGYIGAVSKFEVFDLPKTGDEIVTEISVQNQVFDIAVLSGKVWLGENLMAQCEMKVFSKNE